MSAAVSEHKNDSQIDGYVSIPGHALQLPTFAKIDLYASESGVMSPTLIRGAQVSYSTKQAELLQNRQTILIRRGDLPLASASVAKHIDTILYNNRIGIAERFALLQLAVWDSLEHNARRIYADKFVDIARQISPQIATLLKDSPVTASELYEKSLRDDSRATHLVNVAAYCVLLAQQMGWDDPQEHAEIAFGALLHEFGKIFMPQDLVHKAGRLTVQERELLEKSPQLGYEKLCDNSLVKFGPLMMIYQQQERFDGSGYPVGVEGEEIHEWARILAVADVFDTMISKKTYRRKNRVSETLLYLADNAAKHFDPKVVLCWKNIYQQQ